MTDPSSPPQGHLTFLEACLILGVSSTTMLGWIRDGLLPCRQTRRGTVLVPVWAVVLAGAAIE